MNHTIDLTYLIRPTSLSDFFTQYFQKEVLLVKRANVEYWNGLLKLSEVERVLKSTSLKYPEILMANDGDVDSSHYTFSNNDINNRKVYQLFQEGHTLILNQLHTKVESLHKLCKSLESEFNQTCQTNVYVTPSFAKGFQVHYDSHDVFVIQISGKKQWRIYERDIFNPLESKVLDKVPSKMILEFELEPGDIVYIPSGFAHEASANDGLSVHITLGIIAKMWCDFIAEILHEATTSVEHFRAALPPGIITREEARQTLFLEYQKKLAILNDREVFDAGWLAYVRKYFATRKQMIPNPLSNFNSPNAIGLEQLFTVNRDVLIVMQEKDGVLILEGITYPISFPITYKLPVEFILKATKLRVRDIPGNLDDEVKMLMVYKFVKSGLLYVELE